MRRTFCAFAATAFVMLTATGTAAAQPTDPTDGVLAVVSPVAAPACTAAGLTTFLVPTLGSGLDDALGGAVDVAEVLGQATGPVLVLCGSLPPADGTRCELTDAGLEVLWPAQLSDVGVTSPALGGSLVESLGRLVALAGIELPQLADVLQCSVPAPSNGGALPTPRQPAAGGPAPSTAPATDRVATAAPALRPASPPAAPTSLPTQAPSLASSPAVPGAAIEAAAGRRESRGPLLALLAGGIAAAFWHHAKRPNRNSDRHLHDVTASWATAQMA